MNIKKIIKYLVVPIIISSVYFMNRDSLFTRGNETLFLAILISCFLIEYFIEAAKNGDEVYLRPIAGLKAMEDAVGRATEMGKPVLYVPGISGLDQIDTLAGLTFLGHVSEMTSNYDTSLLVPVCTPIVMEAARETCKESYLKSGHPDLFREDMVQYIADDQFAYVAGVNGIMQREKPAACFYQGKFYAESLILAETGNSIGAIQIAGTGSPAQIPFFVTACDFTLIGEEFFAASSYLSKKPELVGSIKGQDYIKLSSIGLMAICLILSIFRFFEYSNMDSWNEVKNKYEYDQVIIEWNNLDQNSQEILSGFKREDIINLNKKINYRFELIKESILSPHNQAMELKAFSPFIEPEVMIAIIEGISTEEELMNYFNDIMDISFNIKDMTNHAAEEFANIYYNSSLEMYDFNKVSPLNHKALINSLFNSLKSKIKFENLNETSKNTFLGSINVKSFDELTLKNKIRLVNLFVGEKIGVNSEINYPNEVLPVVMIDTTNLKQSRFKSMRIDDLSQLYHYIGEAQSLSFDVNDLFNLKVSK